MRRLAFNIAVMASLALIAAFCAYAFPSIFSLGGQYSGGSFESSPGFLWDYRGIDVMVQGFIVLAATVAISSIFRERQKQGSSERSVEEGSTEEIPPGEEDEL